MAILKYEGKLPGTVSELLRRNMYEKLGLRNIDSNRLNTIEMRGEVGGKINALNEIIGYAINRLTIGYLRYGKSNGSPSEYILQRMQDKLNIFKNTGNAEMLVDIVNYCAIAWKLKNHPNYHFESLDRED